MKRSIKEWLRFGAAAVLTGLILFVAAGVKEKEEVYDIVFLGDIIVGNYGCFRGTSGKKCV